MSVGKFCAKGDDRRATFTQTGGIRWHEEAKEIEIDRVRNHYELECWIKPAKVSSVVSPSGSNGKLARHHVAVPQRADYETPMVLYAQGADVPRVYEGSMKGSTMLPEESQIRCEDKIEKHNCEDKIEKHKYENKIQKQKVTYPVVPWYDICIQPKSKNDFRRRERPEVFPVLQFDYSVTDTKQGQPHFELMFGIDKSTGAIWASAVLVRGKEDLYIVSSILSWLSELGHSTVIIQSDGEPGSEVVLRRVQSKCATMKNPPCEIVQRQSQQYSQQSKEDAEWRIQSIRNQIKAYKIQIDKNSGITIKDDSPSTHMVATTCSMAIHAIPQAARFNNRIRRDQTHVLPKSHFTFRRSSRRQTTRNIVQQTQSSMVGRYLART